MAHQVDQRNAAPPAGPACPTAPSRRRFLGAGLGSGLLGGVCCIGSAVAVGAGISGLSFFSTWLELYQPYFIAASMLVMALWLVRQVRRHARGGGRGALAAFFRGTWRQLVVMAVVYAVTLGIAMAVVNVVEM
jgi:hypothetical protein